MDVDGLWQTGADGKTTFRLSAFICPNQEKFLLPLNVVATPLSLVPRFLTLRRVLVDNGADVEIQVFSWNPDGTPAPNVAFDWRCRAQLAFIIL